MSNYELVKANQAEWVTVEGVDALRVHDSDYIAIPVTGKKNAAHFAVIDLSDRSDIVCQLKKSEVFGWLCKQYLASNNLQPA